MREAKTYTTWTNQDGEYEGRVRAFLEGIMADDGFQKLVEELVDEVRLPGWMSSFAATLIRLTAPGVPDTYQGCELWQHTLVDPDNRGHVDYDHRRSLLDRLDSMAADEVFQEWESGLPKLHLMRAGLALRAERPGAFAADAGYEALDVAGREEPSCIAYRRGTDVIVVARRFHAVGAAEAPAAETVELPSGTWVDRLTGQTVHGGKIETSKLLGSVPGALLVRRRGKK